MSEKAQNAGEGTSEPAPVYRADPDTPPRHSSVSPVTIDETPHPTERTPALAPEPEPAAPASAPTPAPAPAPAQHKEGMSRGLFLACLAAIAILLILVIGLGAGLGVSDRNLRDAKKELAAVTASASGVGAGTATTVTVSCQPSASSNSTSITGCPDMNNNTLYTSPEGKKFLETCGIDYIPADGGTIDLRNVLTTTMAECMNECAADAQCQGAGWGLLDIDAGDQHTCWLKGNLTTRHDARSDWIFAELQQ